MNKDLTTPALRSAAVLTVALVTGGAGACGSSTPNTNGQAEAPAETLNVAAAPAPAANDRADDAAVYLDAARDAWKLIERSYQPETGLINSTPDYPYATSWDIGSAMAALYSAKELGFLAEAEYENRVERLLDTLADAPLFLDVAYHKFYSTETGEMVDRRSRPSAQGYGWSATDLGRLLLWLKIVALDNESLADDAADVVERMDYSQIIRDGYLYGRFIDGQPFQEGRIGYEQYVATGFALWGHIPEKALDLERNMKTIEVLGHELPRDQRKMDRLVSEPFVMMGLEVGWSPQMRKIAEAVLAVQRERWKRTGQVTIVSEDAVSVPPYYFYYYCVLCNGKQFVIDAAEPGQSLDSPRWVSTKNTFGWHALLPSEYTETALAAVRAARGEQGWASGVFEGSGESTRTYDINTAAVILESALYLKEGGPILPRLQARKDAG